MTAIDLSILTSKQRERFWLKVEASNSDACWHWKSAHKAKGYAQFTFYAKGKRYRVAAHRVAYFLQYGSLDPHLDIAWLLKHSNETVE